MVILNKFLSFSFFLFFFFFSLFNNFKTYHKSINIQSEFFCVYAKYSCVPGSMKYVQSSFLVICIQAYFLSFFRVPGSMNYFPFYGYLKQVSFFLFPSFFFFFFRNLINYLKIYHKYTILKCFALRKIFVCAWVHEIFFRLFSLVISNNFSFFRQGIKTLPFVHFISFSGKKNQSNQLTKYSPRYGVFLKPENIWLLV